MDRRKFLAGNKELFEKLHEKVWKSILDDIANCNVCGLPYKPDEEILFYGQAILKLTSDDGIQAICYPCLYESRETMPEPQLD